jgi:hypothetical protein
MVDAKVGEDFIKHEFDESIAIHAAIVAAETKLARTHPVPEARAAIAECLRDDQRFLEQLRALGEGYGATGAVEDVAEGVVDLLAAMVAKADESDSEAYEAHAVLLNAKRKQQDSAGGIVAIARATRDTELRDRAAEFGRMQKESAQELADLLARFAARIATADAVAAPA